MLYTKVTLVCNRNMQCKVNVNNKDFFTNEESLFNFIREFFLYDFKSDVLKKGFELKYSRVQIYKSVSRYLKDTVLHICKNNLQSITITKSLSFLFKSMVENRIVFFDNSVEVSAMGEII